MAQYLRFANGPADESFLHVTELLHRTHNEYARAISFASMVAASSSNQETKAALAEVISNLDTIAEAHLVLRPPLVEGLVDFADNLTRLCGATATSFEMKRRGITLLLVVAEPVFLDAARCWRANLIVFELVYNAFRHAFGPRAGCIAVTVATASERISCQVRDDGSSASTFESGLGTHLVDALAAELDGFVERQFSEWGTTVTLSFPKQSRDLGLRLPPNGGWGNGGETWQ